MDHFKGIWKNLLDKYIANTCTKEELDKLLQMVENGEHKEEFSQVLKDYWEHPEMRDDALNTDLESKISLLMQEAKYNAPIFSREKNLSKMNWKVNYAAAAMIMKSLNLRYIPANGLMV